MSTYLSYDLKGIQSFIFAIPRLRYVIGGSALIDWFDRDYVPQQRSTKVKRIFSGGGRGCFSCADDRTADELQASLTAEVRLIGLGIRFARGPDLTTVISDVGQLFPSLPEESELDGHPCAAGGDWPVRKRDATSDVAGRRIFHRGTRPMYRYRDDLIRTATLPAELKNETVEFFRNVDAEGSASQPEITKAERAAGRAGAAALGNRNRWAVICMDGNDMGAQFHAAHAKLSGSDLVNWYEESSSILDECCRNAFHVGLDRVLQAWVDRTGMDEIKKNCRLEDEADDGGRGSIVIPVRPLVVGGDDMTVLCHSAHAFDFVEAAAQAFADKSRMHAEYWFGTRGELSISAGILFCSTSLPLSAAVAYSEQLLGMAKIHGRKSRLPGHVAPPCVDWEIVTESVIDSPDARRQRMVEFRDEDINQTVRLTRKPYRMDELSDLRAAAQRYTNVPRGITHRLRRVLGQAYWDRRLGVARLAKQQGALAEDVQEGDDPAEATGRWHLQDGVRSIDVLDIVELSEEELRLERQTVGIGG